MSLVLETISHWIEQGQDIAVATVVATRGASPQPVGTKMAINGQGQIAGAVSGGCVEGAVVEAAERVLAGGGPRLMHFADELVGGVGLPCGGEITVWVEPLDQPLAQFLELGRRGHGGVLVSRLTEGELPVSRRLTSLGEPIETDHPDAFIDIARPAPRLIAIGAVAVTGELSAIASLAGWRTFVADPRARFATRERFPRAEEVLAVWPDAAFQRWAPLDRDTAVVVLSHDRKIDDQAITTALDSAAGFVGAIGSRRATDAREQRLLSAGVTPRQLARLSAPIGLDLGGGSPFETALAIFAEVVALRNGRTGGRLIAGAGPIHGGNTGTRRDLTDFASVDGLADRLQNIRGRVPTEPSGIVKATT